MKFSQASEFQVELRRRVDEYFRTTGFRPRDCPQMYVKMAVLFVSFAAVYIALVFFARTWWQAVPLALLMGGVTALIGLNVQHDGSHDAYSNARWLNKAMALSLDFIGASSYFWRGKHVVFHHTYTNIAGHDGDIDIGSFGRLSPHQRHFAVHRFQHIYMWALYGLMTIRWQLYGDFRNVVVGKVGIHRFPRPKRWDLVTFIAGKVWFLALAFGLPLFFHSFGAVLLFYAVAAGVVGLMLSVVFQLAHCVEQAAFPVPSVESGKMETAWAVHQVESSVDFARGNPVVAWLLGGLNFQIEHHLFPRISHIHYPAISKVVEATCQDFGVRYAEHRTFRAGLVSHYRLLRRLGMPAAAA